MDSPKTTPQSRLRLFQNEYLVVRKQQLYCNICKTTIDHVRKSSITQHLDTNQHKEMKKRLNRPDDDDDVVADTIEAFTSSNIPLNKLKNQKFRDYLEKYFKVIY